MLAVGRGAACEAAPLHLCSRSIRLRRPERPHGCVQDRLLQFVVVLLLQPAAELLHPLNHATHLLVEASQGLEDIDERAGRMVTFVRVEDLQGPLERLNRAGSIALFLFVVAENREQTRDTTAVKFVDGLQQCECLSNQGVVFAPLPVVARGEVDQLADSLSDLAGRAADVVALALEQLLEQPACFVVVAEDDPEGHPDVGEDRSNRRHCHAPI